MGLYHKSRRKRDLIVSFSLPFPFSFSLSLSLCVYRFSGGRAKIEFRFVWTNLYRHSVFRARSSTYQNRARTISYSAEQNREEVTRQGRERTRVAGGGRGRRNGRVVFYRVPFGLHTVNISRGKRVAGARMVGLVDQRVTGIRQRGLAGV